MVMSNNIKSFGPPPSIMIELKYNKDKKQVYLMENGVYKAQFAYIREDGTSVTHFHVPDCNMTNSDSIGCPGCSCKINDLRDGNYRIFIFQGKIRVMGRDE